jgi:hypothetical protein
MVWRDGATFMRSLYGHSEAQACGSMVLKVVLILN